jgi:hypothetical protein
MTLYPKVLFLLCFFLVITIPALPQGCSDAGFCSMGAMKPDQPFNKKIEFKLRSMELSFYRGTTTLTPKVYVVTADFNFSLNSRNSVQIKVPYQITDGNFGGVSGVSDISLCYTRNVKSTQNYDISVSVGAKIPSNDSNLKVEDRQLPMYYQTSLGTYDAIVGVSFITRNWLFATGIQHPFNENKNQFKYIDYDPPVYPDPDYVDDYDLATNLKRGTDVMLRVERNFRYSRVNFSVGLLPIYRITKDEIESPAGSGERIKVDKSTGLALSAIVTAGYGFNVRSGVKILVGKRIIHREVNPDGLTREMVTSLSYYYRF